MSKATLHDHTKNITTSASQSCTIDIRSITTQGVLTKHARKLHLYNQEAWTNLTQQFQALPILVMY